MGNQLESGDEVNVAVFLWAEKQLKEFGIHVVYEQEEKRTQHQQDTNPPCQNVIDRDLSEYQVRPGKSSSAITILIPIKSAQRRMTGQPTAVMELLTKINSMDWTDFDIGGLSLLQDLNLSGNPICSKPDSIKCLTLLQSLALVSCSRLQSLPELPMSLNNFDLFKCKSLEMVTNLPNMLSSLDMILNFCDKLVEVQGLFKLVPIVNINAQIINKLGLFDLEIVGKVKVELLNNYDNVKKETSPPGSKHNDPRNTSWNEFYIKTKKTKDLKWSYIPIFVGILEDNEDMIWLSHWNMGKQLEDEVDVSVFLRATVYLKEFGFHVVYEQENNDTQQDAYLPSLNVIDHDLSAYQVRLGLI
ncbi:unnamed protein product [Camellia sinensis]